MIPIGKYGMKAVPGEFNFSETPNKNKYVVVLTEITDGPQKGNRITYRGFLTEKAAQRTMVDLRTMGWDGKDLTALKGVGTLPWTGEVQHETRDGKTYVNLRWVNPPGSGGLVKNPLDKDAIRELAISLGAADSGGDDIPF